jgi:hypothetical protein
MAETGTLDRIATVDEVARVIEDLWARSCQARCYASMAGDSAGRGETGAITRLGCAPSPALQASAVDLIFSPPRTTFKFPGTPLRLIPTRTRLTRNGQAQKLLRSAR